MWTPDWLYRRLPLLYVVLGLGCLGLLRPGTATATSAALFFGAAGLIWWQRRDARRWHEMDSSARGRRIGRPQR